ncbi:MAG: Hpt domain-containing protein, partial [Sulfuriferula sp.]
PGATRPVHELKGAAGYIHAHHIANSCSELENLISTENWVAARSQYQQLSTVFNQAQRFILATLELATLEKY